jgi:hypothetical protein
MGPNILALFCSALAVLLVVQMLVVPLCVSPNSAVSAAILSELLEETVELRGVPVRIRRFAIRPQMEVLAREGILFWTVPPAPNISMHNRRHMMFPDWLPVLCSQDCYRKKQFYQEPKYATGNTLYNLQALSSMLHVARSPDEQVELRRRAKEIWEIKRNASSVSMLGKQQARFHAYRLPMIYGKRGFFKLSPTWTSGIATAFDLLGDLLLWRATNSTCYLDTALEYYRAFLFVRRNAWPWEGGLVISYADQFERLVLEEYPTKEGISMVLAGHIITTLSLYYLQQLFPRDQELEVLLLAALNCAYEYSQYFRSPGKTNHYWLAELGWPDYGPARMVHLQHALYELTGASRFRDLREMFCDDNKQRNKIDACGKP